MIASNFKIGSRIGTAVCKASAPFAIGLKRYWVAEITAILMVGLAMPQPYSFVTPACADDQDSGSIDQSSENRTGDRTIRVLVFDDEGQPVEDANIQVGIWHMPAEKGAETSKEKDYPRHYKTDEEGTAEVLVPERIQILRLWATKQHYVPLFTNFAEDTHENGRLIPDRYKFQMQLGSKVGGIVVDQDGDPIPNVKVSVRVDMREKAAESRSKKTFAVQSGKASYEPPAAAVSTWLAQGSDDAITDEAGRWSITNAPDGADAEFRTRFVHDDFISDTRWGELQREQGISTGDLRSGVAKLVMRGGTAVTGVIRDEAGNPVTKGIVVWDDRPYWSSAVCESEIQEDGSFRTIGLPPGEHFLTVVAKGHMPSRRTVTITDNMPAENFTLQPGKRIAIRIVDTDGNPIPKASVSLQGWRQSESLYNVRHPNVLNSEIPSRADEDGLFVWEWAPDDAVTYYIAAKGYGEKTISLVAKDAEHVIAIPRPLKISGTVNDAVTGDPLEAFRVIPVDVFGPQFLSTAYNSQVISKDGKYKIRCEFPFGDDRTYRIRIEADGYRSAICDRSFGYGDGSVSQHFELDPAPAKKGLVLTPSGQPAADATIVLGTPSIVPHISDGKLGSGGGDEKSLTAKDGTFRVAATFEPMRIRVHHEFGYADVLREPDEAPGTIHLQPWARISGRLLQDGKPIANQRVYFRPIVKGNLGEPRFQEYYSAVTAKDGYYAFDFVGPIAGAVAVRLSPWEDSPLTSSHSVPVDLEPGENRIVDFGAEGTVITGSVVATGRVNKDLDKNWSLSYLIRRDGGIAPPANMHTPSFNPADPVQPSWFLDAAHGEWLATQHNHFVKIAPDGKFSVHGVEPGEYDLVVRLYEQPAGCLVETIGEKVVPITVTSADVDAVEKATDVIKVPCRSGPRVGQSMAAYQFTDTSGVVRYIDDLKGRYVLMHVWASWCQPCLESMPNIKALSESTSDLPMTVIGLNLDEQSERAKSMAQKGGWRWAQNYLGADSAMARQLAISSVPTYFLIGPDGNLLASANQWKEISQRVQDSLSLD